ncbi:piggyBac transposable element-derived protein 3-like [Montipora capricornis]|uniref:piggyBac transposable element-derived protein 3-like n=1 Tax=Montipora capricornis TaxID=246305 RepID=UPI0035F11C56
MQPITQQEMYGFLGINIFMGYHKLPSWADYWRIDPDLQLSVPFVSSTLSRNRFSQILGNLHIYDNHAVPEGNKDKLLKVRSLITAMNNNYTKLYNVLKKVSIDESTIRSKGRHSIKQYNPMKPIKHGYKLWVRADMDGYISKFDVYQGKSVTSSGVSQDSDSELKFRLGEQVVQCMTKIYFTNTTRFTLTTFSHQFP